MKVSPFCKRFKRTHFTGDTFTLPDMRSSIIRTMQGYQSHTNTDDLKRIEKEPQNRGIQNQNTDKINSVYVRALFALPYANMLFSGHVLRPDGYVLHVQVNTKPKTYLINEMEEHSLVFYSYATKYHKLASMFIYGYQCLNVYINVEKGALINKDIQ